MYPRHAGGALAAAYDMRQTYQFDPLEEAPPVRPPRRMKYIVKRIDDDATTPMPARVPTAGGSGGCVPSPQPPGRSHQYSPPCHQHSCPTDEHVRRCRSSPIADPADELKIGDDGDDREGRSATDTGCASTAASRVAEGRRPAAWCRRKDDQDQRDRDDRHLDSGGDGNGRAPRERRIAAELPQSVDQDRDDRRFGRRAAIRRAAPARPTTASGHSGGDRRRSRRGRPNDPGQRRPAGRAMSAMAEWGCPRL